MQTWLTDVAGLGLPRLLKAKMLCCILRILLIWNISHSCSNFLQPTVTNCCFLRKSELVQFASNRKCIQGWDSADFPCTQKASPAGGWVLEDSYWLIYFSGYLLWMEWWGLHKIVCLGAIQASFLKSSYCWLFSYQSWKIKTYRQNARKYFQTPDIAPKQKEVPAWGSYFSISLAVGFFKFP